MYGLVKTMWGEKNEMLGLLNRRVRVEIMY